MGWTFHWLAVRGRDPEELLRDLGLQKSGAIEETPESLITCTSLANGWFVVYASDFVWPVDDTKLLNKLSADCELVSCAAHENSLTSVASAHANGVQRWRVEHISDEGVYHLDSKGDLPLEFDGIFKTRKREQDRAPVEPHSVDFIYDVPLLLAKAATSFHHSEPEEGQRDKPFDVLEVAPVPARLGEKSIGAVLLLAGMLGGAYAHVFGGVMKALLIAALSIVALGFGLAMVLDKLHPRLVEYRLGE